MKYLIVVIALLISNINNAFGQTKQTLLWGAFPGGNSPEHLQKFESVVGSEVKIMAIFHHWGNDAGFPTNLSEISKKKNY